MSFSDAEIDAAITALSEPGRLRRRAGRRQPRRPEPADGCWAARCMRAAGSTPRTRRPSRRRSETADPHDRLVAVRTLFAEETRLTMLVGVAIGFELARELGYDPSEVVPGTATEED